MLSPVQIYQAILLKMNLNLQKFILFYFIEGTALQGFVCSSDLFQSGQIQDQANKKQKN